MTSYFEKTLTENELADPSVVDPITLCEISKTQRVKYRLWNEKTKKHFDYWFDIESLKILVFISELDQQQKIKIPISNDLFFTKEDINFIKSHPFQIDPSKLDEIRKQHLEEEKKRKNKIVKEDQEHVKKLHLEDMKNEILNMLQNEMNINQENVSIQFLPNGFLFIQRNLDAPFQFGPSEKDEKKKRMEHFKKETLDIKNTIHSLIYQIRNSKDFDSEFIKQQIPKIEQRLQTIQKFHDSHDMNKEIELAQIFSLFDKLLSYLPSLNPKTDQEIIK